MKCDMNFINNYMKNIPIIYAFGFSNGGMMLSNQSFKYNNIKKVLILNSPLMFNWHKIKEGVKKFNQDKMTFIFGSLDQSFGYLPLLENVKNSKVEIIKFENRDHQFIGYLDEFLELPFKYLLN